MKKWFVLLTSILMICVMMGSACVIAEAVEGDEYELNPEGWPDKHWAYMTEDEIASYEAKGWKRESRTLWYNSDGKYAEDIDSMTEIFVDDISSYYNQGYSFHIIYHWTCDGRLLGKHQEQSVYVGRWILSPDEAKECHMNGIQPLDFPYSKVNQISSLPEYYSIWYYEGKEAKAPEDVGDLGYTFERIAYDAYDFGYGSKMYLRNGTVISFTLEEIVELGAVDYEMVHWE